MLSKNPPTARLASKLARPRVPHNYIGRPRVAALLDDGTHRGVTVVSAGAGWGKTLTTAAWAGAEPDVGPVAWVSLEAADNEPRSFWTSVVTALRAAVRVPPDNPIAQLAPGLGSESVLLERLLAGLEQLPAPVVLVLDDFHLIDDATALEGMAGLLRHAPHQLRLIILTRADPALPLHRLRMTDDLTEIRSRDLAFDETDAASMFSADGVTVASDDVRLLLERTEGWPAGMRLAALFMRRPDVARDAASFAGDDQAVTDYLVGEVLASQPPALQRFLLRTSIAAQLSSGLAETLTGEAHSQQHLENLEASNAFVVGLGSGREWFRYHALLREVLQHRLRVEDPTEVARLHMTAAHWFAANGQPIDAMHHAADAEDWQLLARLFVDHAVPLIVSADRTAVGHVLERIPRKRLGDGAELALCAAARVFFTGRYAEMAPHLEAAAVRMSITPPVPGGGEVVAHLLLSGVVKRAHGDVAGALSITTRVLDELAGPAATLPSATDSRAVALSNLGTALLWSGRLDEAVTCLEEGLLAAAGTRLDAARINTLSCLALADAAAGRLEAAVEHADMAIDLLEARGWAPLAQSAAAYLSLALVHFRRNDIHAARHALAQAEPALHEPTTRWAVRLLEARMEASLGRADHAREVLVRLEHDRAEQELPPFLEPWLLLAESGTSAQDVENQPELAAHVSREPLAVIAVGRRLLHRGEAGSADAVLAPVREGATGEAVDAWVLTALAADRLREDNRAVAAMQRAVELARSQNVRRPFFELQPEHVVRLLELVRQLDQTADEFLVDLLAGLQPARAPVAEVPIVAESLTERELIVLRFLPTMMTNAEIATELLVSVNTVKAHLKRIFRKLEVSTRRQAVHRARDLDLLSDAQV